MKSSDYGTVLVRRTGGHFNATIGHCTAAAVSATLAARLAASKYFEVPEEEIDLIVINDDILRAGVKQPDPVNFWPTFWLLAACFAAAIGGALILARAMWKGIS